MSQEIVDKLNQANAKLDTMLQWRAGLEERCKAHLEKTEEVRTTLFENPGLKSQVQTLMNGKRTMSRWRDFWMYVLKIIVASFIIGLAVWLLSIYRSST